jgi:hypothetical protein
LADEGTQGNILTLVFRHGLPFSHGAVSLHLQRWRNRGRDVRARELLRIESGLHCKIKIKFLVLTLFFFAFIKLIIKSNRGP